MIARAFESPSGLVWLAAATLALCVWLGVSAWRHDRRRRVWVGESAGLAVLLPDAALVVAVVGIGLALCGPLLGERDVRVDDTGMDVVLLVDASRSMDAGDTPPSRLHRAKTAGRAIVDALGPGDRAALVAFAGTGRRLAPLTPDRDVLQTLIDRIDSRIATPHASDLAAGLAAALETFEPDAGRRRAVVLLGDGEWPADGPADLGALTARANVHVFAALFGREVGATIPDHGVPLIAPDGQAALTRRETRRARALAEATGGEVVLADRWGRIDAAALVAAVHGDLGAPGGQPGGGPSGAPVFERRRVPTPVPFAVLAFGLLLVEGPLRDRIGVRRRRSLPPAAAPMPHRRRRWASAAVALLTIVAGAGAAGPREAPDPDLRGLGTAWLRAGARAIEQGDDDDALRAFRSAAATALSPDVAGTAHYQIGVWHLKHDDPVRARDAFLESLRLFPNQLDAAFNLEWSQLAIEARREVEKKARPPLAPRATEPETPEDVRDETSSDPNAPDEDDPERPRGHAPEPRPSGQIRPNPQGPTTTGPNREAGASGRPLPDPEALSWWLDLVEDDPGRAQVPDRARGRGPKRRGPAW